METESCTVWERTCHFVVGLTVILVSYSAALLAAQFFITRL